MKSIISLVFGMVFFCHASFAQCKIFTKTDDFTGAVTSWTKQVKIASDGVPGILKGAGNVDCSFKVFLHFVSGKGKVVLVLTERSDMCGCATASISLKFSNNTVLTKTNVRFGQEKTKTATESEQYSYFDLTKEELTMLSNLPIAKFRLKYQGCSEHPVIEEEMTNNDGEKIQESAKCIAQNIGKN